MSVVPFRPHAARVVDLDTLRRDRAITDARMELTRLKERARIECEQINTELDARSAKLLAAIHGAQEPLYDVVAVEELHVRLAEVQADWQHARRRWAERWWPVLHAAANAVDRATGVSAVEARSVVAVPAARRPAGGASGTGGDAA
jgi:cell division septum initiation protein DivIVA